MREDARIAVAVAALLWAAAVAWSARREPVASGLPRQALWILGGVLLLSPTLHPWYLLWVLPWAALLASPGWLLLGATILLTYAGPPGDVPGWLKWIVFLPPAAVGFWEAARGRARIRDR